MEEFLIREILLTFFCLCGICTGKWKGHLTSTGEAAVPFWTIACEKKLTMERWIVYIEGEGLRKCSTVGGAIGRGRMDLLLPSHHGALEGGRKRRRVFFLWKGAK